MRDAKPRVAGWAAGLGLAALIVAGGVAVKGVWPLPALSALLGLSSPLSSDRERPRLAALAAAVGQQRPIEARASGGFAWAPFTSPVRANLPAQVRSSEWQSRAAVLAAADAVRRDALNAPGDALALADLGVAHLVTGAPARAADVLEEARDRAPSDARILNDLAAAYLARGHANEKAEDLARAADAAERATRLDAARLEAWFNRAVALQKLRLDEAARAAWREYLRRDAASAWAEEARTRLATLERHQPPVSRNELEAVLTGELSPAVVARLELNVSPVRDYVDNALLPQWASETIAAQGRPDTTTAALDAATRLAAHTTRIGGDPHLRESVDVLRAAARATSRARLALAQGVIARRDGRAAIERGDIARASGPLAQARRSLAPFPSLALDAELYHLIAEVQAGRSDEAVPGLERLERRSAERGYRYLAARADLLRGLVLFRRANFTEAQLAFERAVAGLRQARENAFLATALTYHSEVLSALGEHERAWVSQIEAFSLLDLVTDLRRRHAVLVTGGLLPLQEGLAGAAVHVQLAALENAGQWNVAGSHVAARLQLAQSFAALQQRAQAETVLAEAKTWAARIPDATLRGQYLVELALAQGDVAAAAATAADAPRAIEAYSEALRGVEAIKSWYRLSPIYLKRGRAHVLRGDWEAAERDWREGVTLVEEQRRTVREGAQRIAHLEELWDLYAGLIELEAVRRGNAEAALALAERGRARVLLESMEAGQAAPGLSAPGQSATGLAATRLSAAWTGARPLAPEGTTAVVYVALDRQLLIWVVSPRDVSMTTVDVSRVALQRLVAAFRERLNDGDEARDLAGRLYALTWAPIAAHLQGRSSIAIVPDGPLASLPFAALDDNKTYLIERHALSLAPSLATLRMASERIAAAATASGAAATSRRALIAADPAIDRTRYPSLPVLQAAREEADGIAALYERPTVLRGQEVTRARLIAELSRADLLHFAGHAISNDVRPDQAHLVVSAAEGGAGAARLDVADIAALRLDGVRLVVLSACQTGTGRAARGEGTLSLARPFLVAGVPTVVATLWLVDDRTARDMMLELHRRLRAGDAPDVALQRVQLARLREARLSAGSRSSSTVPATLAWADFVVVGAAHKSQR